MEDLQYHIEPYILIDEVSETDFYIGTCSSGNSTASALWKIKKIWKDGTIIKFGFPDGNQSFSFVWDNRTEYTYK